MAKIKSKWIIIFPILSMVAMIVYLSIGALTTETSGTGVDGVLVFFKNSWILLLFISFNLIAIILALVMAFSLPGSIVALGTSLFFEICAAAFLPVFLGALYWKGITRLGAIAGILSGTVVSLFWLIFVFAKTATGIGICKFIFGVDTLLSAAPWPYIDVMLIAVPISAIFVIVVSLLTKPPATEVIDNAFKNIDNKGSEA